jgi:polar amino acid transport system substrate-binding protein
MAFHRALTLLSVAGLVMAACAAPAATTAPTASPTLGPTASPTTAPTATPTLPPTPSPTASPDACAPETLTLKTPGRLTLSTDLPAFPPWFGGDAHQQLPNEPVGGSPWSESEFSAEPYSGLGFEGAMAYAVAMAMGFSADKVDWIANPVFAQAFAPGVKPFDFHMAQISITEERAQAVTFSDPYLDSNQSLLALSANDISQATSIADLKPYRFGAASNTTSFDFLEGTIAPTAEPQVFDDNVGALAALKGDIVDGIIVDLATAIYMRDAEVDDFNTDEPEGKVVGQFGPPATPDEVGFVLELDNPLVTCVNQALATIKANGTQQAILDEWINTGEDIPFLQ